MKDDEPEPSEFEAIDVIDKVKIFATTDEKIKFLGELLSNESSRAILILLTENEMSANDIAEKINLRLSSVIHHLNKMLQLGIVKVSRIGKSPKNHDVKFYSAKPGILIFPKDTADRAKKSKTLSSSLKRVFKFAAIGLTSLFTWLLLYNPPSPVLSQTSGEYSISDTLIIPLLIIIIGLILERTLYQIKKRKGGLF